MDTIKHLEENTSKIFSWHELYQRFLRSVSQGNWSDEAEYKSLELIAQRIYISGPSRRLGLVMITH